MTKEEIQQSYDALWPLLPTGQTMGLEDHNELERLVIAWGHSLISKAYKECLDILDAKADEVQKELDETFASNNSLEVAQRAGDAIRALADSISGEGER